eukprot:TRINITY_DN2118_c0_g2_i2.p1 TRINITY_DN2118_c0_g2~~TRINITY_DN2118_c0_g2_i2.p1  ORF type:complete len:780 (+),score=211.76 TRINITY_DN2118_c0_g2_i2:422-2761(+)
MQSGCGWHRDKAKLIGQRGVVIEVYGTIARVKLDSGQVVELPLPALESDRALTIQLQDAVRPSHAAPAEGDVGAAAAGAAVALLSLLSRPLLPASGPKARKPQPQALWHSLPPDSGAKASSRARGVLRRRASIRRMVSEWRPPQLGGAAVPKGLPGPTGPAEGWEALVAPENAPGAIFWCRQQSEVWIYNGLAGADGVVTVTPVPAGFVPADGVSKDEQGLRLCVASGETAQLGRGDMGGCQVGCSVGPPDPRRMQQEASAQQAEIAELLAQQAARTGKGDARAAARACAEAGSPWVDPEFPPVPASLGPVSCGVVQWQPPSRWLCSSACDHTAEVPSGIFLAGDPEPADLRQGRLGDCYLIASLCCVAERPAELRALFLPPGSGEEEELEAERKGGCWSLRLCLDGLWRTVQVDSWIPVAGRAPVFCQPAREPGELWAPLLEKAFAKWHGSYEAIVGGDALHTLHDLTGCPTARIDLTAPAAFDDLLRYHQLGCLLYLGTPEKKDCSEEEYAEAGLCAEHGFTLLHAVRHRGVELVCLRNPHASGRAWRGPWGPASALWGAHLDVSAACGNRPGSTAADGTFWMPWAAARAWFDSSAVCLTMRGWRCARTVVELRGGLPSLLLLLEAQDDSGAEVIAGLHQPQRDRRATAAPAGLQLVTLAKGPDGRWGGAARSAGGALLRARDVWLQTRASSKGLLLTWRGQLPDGPTTPLVLSLRSPGALRVRILPTSAVAGGAAGLFMQGATVSLDDSAAGVAPVQLRPDADPAPLDAFSMADAT